MATKTLKPVQEFKGTTVIELPQVMKLEDTCMRYAAVVIDSKLSNAKMIDVNWAPARKLVNKEVRIIMGMEHCSHVGALTILLQRYKAFFGE